MLSQAPSMPSYCLRRIQQAADRGWPVYPHACGVTQCGICVLPFGFCEFPVSHRQDVLNAYAAVTGQSFVSSGTLANSKTHEGQSVGHSCICRMAQVL